MTVKQYPEYVCPREAKVMMFAAVIEYEVAVTTTAVIEATFVEAMLNPEIANTLSLTPNPVIVSVPVEVGLVNCALTWANLRLSPVK